VDQDSHEKSNLEWGERGLPGTISHPGTPAPSPGLEAPAGAGSGKAGRTWRYRHGWEQQTPPRSPAASGASTEPASGGDGGESSPGGQVIEPAGAPALATAGTPPSVPGTSEVAEAIAALEEEIGALPETPPGECRPRGGGHVINATSSTPGRNEVEGVPCIPDLAPSLDVRYGRLWPGTEVYGGGLVINAVTTILGPPPPEPSIPPAYQDHAGGHVVGHGINATSSTPVYPDPAAPEPEAREAAGEQAGISGGEAGWVVSPGLGLVLGEPVWQPTAAAVDPPHANPEPLASGVPRSPGLSPIPLHPMTPASPEPPEPPESRRKSMACLEGGYTAAELIQLSADRRELEELGMAWHAERVARHCLDNWRTRHRAAAGKRQAKADPPGFPAQEAGPAAAPPTVSPGGEVASDESDEASFASCQSQDSVATPEVPDLVEDLDLLRAALRSGEEAGYGACLLRAFLLKGKARHAWARWRGLSPRLTLRASLRAMEFGLLVSTTNLAVAHARRRGLSAVVEVWRVGAAVSIARRLEALESSAGERHLCRIRRQALGVFRCHAATAIADTHHAEIAAILCETRAVQGGLREWRLYRGCCVEAQRRRSRGESVRLERLRIALRDEVLREVALEAASAGTQDRHGGEAAGTAGGSLPTPISRPRRGSFSALKRLRWRQKRDFKREQRRALLWWREQADLKGHLDRCSQLGSRHAAQVVRLARQRAGMGWWRHLAAEGDLASQLVDGALEHAHTRQRRRTLQAWRVNATREAALYDTAAVGHARACLHRWRQGASRLHRGRNRLRVLVGQGGNLWNTAASQRGLRQWRVLPVLLEASQGASGGGGGGGGVGGGGWGGGGGAISLISSGMT